MYNPPEAYEVNGYDVPNSQNSGSLTNEEETLKKNTDVEIKLLIPAEVVKASDENGVDLVDLLRNHSGCDVQMSTIPEFYPDTDEQGCVIKGKISEVMTVMDAVLGMIKEDVKPNYRKDKYDLNGVNRLDEMKLVVSNVTAGVVIGKSGKNVEEIRKATGANIQVYAKGNQGSPERVITIGSKENKVTLDAIERVLEKLLGDPLPSRRAKNQEVPTAKSQNFRDKSHSRDKQHSRYEPNFRDKQYSRHEARPTYEKTPRDQPLYEFRPRCGIQDLKKELTIIEHSHSADIQHLSHSRRLLVEEASKLNNNLNSNFVDLSSGKSYTKLVKCIFLPQSRAGIDVVERLLGTGGETLQQICRIYECKIGIGGAGSYRNAQKERDMLESGDPRYIHLSCPLHAEVSISGQSHLVYTRLAKISLLIHKLMTISDAFEQDGIYIKASGAIQEKGNHNQSPRKRQKRTYDEPVVYEDRNPSFDANRTSYF